MITFLLASCAPQLQFLAVLGGLAIILIVATIAFWFNGIMLALRDTHPIFYFLLVIYCYLCEYFVLDRPDVPSISRMVRAAMYLTTFPCMGHRTPF